MNSISIHTPLFLFFWTALNLINLVRAFIYYYIEMRQIPIMRHACRASKVEEYVFYACETVQLALNVGYVALAYWLPVKYDMGIWFLLYLAVYIPLRHGVYMIAAIIPVNEPA